MLPLNKIRKIDLHQAIIKEGLTNKYVHNNIIHSSLTRGLLTGTSGIGKSCFLIYTTIRLLSESDENNPQIIFFQPKSGDIFYCFVGTSFVRSGVYDDFEVFFRHPNVWYFVDGRKDVEVVNAKTLVNLSPKSLASTSNSNNDSQYQEFDKVLLDIFYMSPWSVDE